MALIHKIPHILYILPWLSSDVQFDQDIKFSEKKKKTSPAKILCNTLYGQKITVLYESE